jgi:hypothetical protein
MTIVSQTVIHMKPGANWDDIQKQLKKANELGRKHGNENVTVMVGMAGGPPQDRSLSSRPLPTG